MDETQENECILKLLIAAANEDPIIVKNLYVDLLTQRIVQKSRARAVMLGVELKLTNDDEGATNET